MRNTQFLWLLSTRKSLRPRFQVCKSAASLEQPNNPHTHTHIHTRLCSVQNSAADGVLREGKKVGVGWWGGVG